MTQDHPEALPGSDLDDSLSEIWFENVENPAVIIHREVHRFHFAAVVRQRGHCGK